MFGRAIAEKALAKLKAERVANNGKLPLEPWLDCLGRAIEEGVVEHMAEITGEPILTKMTAPRRKELFDAFVSACSYNPDEITRAKGAEITTAIRDIRLVNPEVTGAEISRRAKVYTSRHKDWALTPTSLAKWWGDIPPAKPVIDTYAEPPNGWRTRLREIEPEMVESFYEKSWGDLRPLYGKRIWAACSPRGNFE